MPRGLRDSDIKLGTQAPTAGYSQSQLRALAAGLLCMGRTRHDAELPRRFDDDDELVCFLTGVTTTAPTRRHAITLLRGAQAGALLHGLLLELPANLFEASGPGLTGVPLTQPLAERIRAGVASPVNAAALATVLFTGYTPHDLAKIPISALSPEATTLSWDVAERNLSPQRHALTVPAPARPMLSAARSFLLLRGAEPSLSLFSGAIGNQRQILTATAERAGIALPAPTSASQCWTLRAAGWWVGTSLHNDTGYSR
jgi:hypothetical protein